MVQAFQPARAAPKGCTTNAMRWECSRASVVLFQSLLVRGQRVRSKTDERDVLDLRMLLQEGPDLTHRDPRRSVEREAVGAGADGGEGDGAEIVFKGERQRVAIAVGEKLVLVAPAALPDRARRCG